MMLNVPVTQIWQLSRTPQLVLVYRRLKLHEIAEELKISEGNVFTILHEHLSMRKLCLKLVPRLITIDQSIVCNYFQRKKGLFAKICDNGWNMDPPLHSGVKSAVSWGQQQLVKAVQRDQRRRICWQGFGIRILGWTRYFVPRFPWENHRISILRLVWYVFFV